MLTQKMVGGSYKFSDLLSSVNIIIEDKLNGIDNKMIYPNDFIPDGWTKGRSTPWQSN